MKCKECGYDLPANGGPCRVCRRQDEWETKGRERACLELFTKRIAQDLETVTISIHEQHVLDLQQGKGLFLYGAPGSGKTLYACALALEVKRRGLIYPNNPRYKIKFTDCLNLLHIIRSSFEDGNNTTNHILDEYTQVGLLILDDLGAERATDWSLQIVQMIVNNRYEGIQPTIITSNFGLNDLSRLLDDRLVSRINGMCRSISFGEKDHRLETKE